MLTLVSSIHYLSPLTLHSCRGGRRGAGAYPSHHRVKAGYTLDKPTQRDKQAFTPMDNLELAIHLSCMFVDCGRNSFTSLRPELYTITPNYDFYFLFFVAQIGIVTPTCEREKIQILSDHNQGSFVCRNKSDRNRISASASVVWADGSNIPSVTFQTWTSPPSPQP